MTPTERVDWSRAGLELRHQTGDLLLKTPRSTRGGVPRLEEYHPFAGPVASDFRPKERYDADSRD